MNQAKVRFCGGCPSGHFCPRSCLLLSLGEPLQERTRTLSELFRGRSSVSVHFYAFWCIAGAKVSFLGIVIAYSRRREAAAGGLLAALCRVKVRLFRTGCFAIGGPRTSRAPGRLVRVFGSESDRRNQVRCEVSLHFHRKRRPITVVSHCRMMLDGSEVRLFGISRNTGLARPAGPESGDGETIREPLAGLASLGGFTLSIGDG
jgi:hypothetical protein